MTKKPPIAPIHEITRQEEIDRFCEECRREGRFGFDTEFVMEDRYATEACLLQLATAKSIYLIDPFLDLDLAPIWDLVADPTVETVVHAGQEDLNLSVQHSKKIPQNVFDLQIAAGLVGYDYPISLMKLVQSTLHVRLHKSKTLTDWRRRPLTPSQLQYAAEDVIYLLDAHRIICDKLSKMRRIEWAQHEFRRYEEQTLYCRTDEDKLFRIKGSGSLKGRQLAIVRDVLNWRDEVAHRYNRPARALLKDHLLVEIARHELSQVSEIKDLRGVSLRDSDVRRLAEVVKSAMDSSCETWPTPKPRMIEKPHESALVSLASAVVRGYCVEHKLAYGLVATQRSIRALIRHRLSDGSNDLDDVELLQGWRGETVGVMLDEVLAGKRSLSVRRLGDRLNIHVTPTNGQEDS